VFVTAERFGRLEFSADLCAGVPVVGVVGRDFGDLLSAEPMPGTIAADPAGPALIAFTSGTTRDPKGVIHSHQTLGFETRQLAERFPADRGAQLTAAPVGHFIGMVNAFLIPVLDGTPVNLTDVWDPARVLALMRGGGLTVGGGAPYYLTSLLDHPGFGPGDLARLKYACLGGAPVPAAVTNRLAGLGITVWRSYGSTEHPSITGSPHTAPEPKRLYTGGENISALEVEEVLLGMPGVAEAAVVAAPDDRLGEHAAAVLRMRPGSGPPTQAQLRAHLERAGLARQKWPEELHVMTDFPRTASGKVQKFILRRDIAARRV
jgi:acyl-CoA synthetase (AMP-forming)/AMP-acid ligase II